MAGETIWFKGYLLDATVHNIDSISHVLYVDLIKADAQTVVQHLTFECIGGTTNGNIDIDSSLSEGMYTIRAYTNYMRNFPEDFFFKKDIKIWQTKTVSKADNQDLAEMTVVADCQFFPEGGNLVENINSRVGFKAVNKWGHGVDIEGNIVDENQDSITFFKSEHLGIGMFNLTPQPNKKYFAKIKKSDGSSITFLLPKAQSKGFVMQIDNVSGKNDIKIYISSSHPQANENAEELVLVGQQRGQICFTARMSNKKNTIPLSISRKNIPDDGIVHVTLFNSAEEPICERLIFIKKQEQQVKLKLTSDKTTYKPREKVLLTLEATDSSGAPIQGNFSLSATDSKQVINSNYESNILTYILLCSDLKGIIEDPAYYFKPKDFTATRHLDLLMMTQGWRRFIWKDVLDEKYPKIDFGVEAGLSITGKVVKYNKKAYPNAQMTLFLKSGDTLPPFLSIGTCDSSGKFGFYNLHFKDTCKVLVQAQKPKGGKNLDILLDQISTPNINKLPYPYYPLGFDEASFTEFLKRASETLEFEKKLKLSQDKMLQTVEIKARKKEKIDTRRIYGANTGRNIKLTDNDCMTYRNAFSIVETLIPGIRVNFSDGEYTVTSRNGTLSFAIDGVMTDNAFIESIQPCEIESIDVLRGPEAAIFGGSGGTAGVVNILTKYGNPDYKGPLPPSQGIVTTNRVGYKIVREFYAPQYNVYKPEHDLPDFRSTLFWHPSVKTDANGKALISFWNSDAQSKIQVNIEGFSNTGRLGVGRLEYMVQ